jgi:hypothetical protein
MFICCGQSYNPTIQYAKLAADIEGDFRNDFVELKIDNVEFTHQLQHRRAVIFPI